MESSVHISLQHKDLGKLMIIPCYVGLFFPEVGVAALESVGL
jgi:hypothetical protein